MAHFDSKSAQVRVFTFAQGLLAGLGHDLELEVTSFEIHLGEPGPAVRGRFRADSLRVISAVKGGRAAPSSLTAKDAAEIERTLRQAVLHAERYPEILFESSHAPGHALEGQLTLHGTTGPLRVTLREEAGARLAEASIDQRAFGMVPYRAMLGALKVEPVVRVVVRLPPSSG